jgi:hypothetical protein
MLRNKYLRLLLALVVAGLLSLLVGLIVSSLASTLDCEGEDLGCNIDDAIGAYLAMIFAALAPLIYGVTLAVAMNRTALLGATLVLLAPLVTFYFLAEGEGWYYVGFYPYPALRTFLVLFVPPFVTILTQWLVLRNAIRRGILA